MNANRISLWKSGQVLFLIVALACCFFGNASSGDKKGDSKAAKADASPAPAERLTSRPCPAEAPVQKEKVGAEIKTEAGQRRRVVLESGIVLFVNQNTEVKYTHMNQLKLLAGEIYLQVPPRKKDGTLTPFFVDTPHKNIGGAQGSWAIRCDAKGTDISVVRGGVKIEEDQKQIIILAGEQLARNSNKASPLPRASHLLDWTKDLMAAAASPLVPSSQHAGGSLVAVDPNGQEAKITLRKFHIDVHIEDGFARTTIDQTYFNNESFQLEGTFYFPLPPDASLSRLAMYVDGNLMEGGMAEREHARNVYETIRYANRDPALLEWVDGSTFKMRVFPLEARTEKRIVLSYTQRLSSLYGQTQYRFPAGHSMQKVDVWSFHARVKDGADFAWSSPSHPALKSNVTDNDLLLDVSARNAATDRDVVVELNEKAKQGETARLSIATHEKSQYLMVRFRPKLASGNIAAENGRRLWLFLFESSGDRDPLLGRAQIEVVKNVLTHVDANDHFMVATAGTRVRFHAAKPQTVTPENVKSALAFLDHAHLIGALDLGHAFDEVKKYIYTDEYKANPSARMKLSLIHVGTGVPAMGERRDDELVKRLPADTRYVGVGVGRRWNRAFMKAAAEKTGGHFTQINPDEPIAWRAFDLFATLNTPRLMNIEVVAQDGQTEQLKPRGESASPAFTSARPQFLVFNQSIAQGEEICAVTRCGQAVGHENDKRDRNFELPKNLKVKGTLNGKAVEFPLKVENANIRADYLPRTWAKLEIDRLLAEDAREHRQTIIDLSKAMYVMTPFTSLLVLEHEDLYTQYKVDRGRKDHWAMYACPAKIPVVYEPEPGQIDPKNLKGKQTAKAVATTVLVRKAVRFIGPGDYGRPQRIANDDIANIVARPPAMLPPEANLPPDARWFLRGSEIAEDFHVSDRESGVSLFARGSKVAFKRDLRDRKSIRQLEDLLPELDKSISDQKFLEGGGMPRGVPLFDSQLGRSGARGRGPIPGPGGGELHAPDPFMATDLSPAAHAMYLDIGKPSEAKARPRGLDVSNTREMLEFRIARGRDLDGAKLDPGQLSLGGFAYRPQEDQHDVSLLYRRPNYLPHDRVFYDLVAYAPGMNSGAADLQAVLEAEALPEPWSKIGQIDDSARDLIENSRFKGWAALKISDNGKHLGFTLVFDSQGRYAYERTLPMGITERVVCDGKTLHHLYPQLHIGAKREVSRFHRADFAAIAPWYVPPAAELARGADVKLIDSDTVAIVPHYEAKLVELNKRLKEAFDKKKGSAEAKKDDVPRVEWLRVQLVFAKGRWLAERNVLRMPQGEIVYRQLIDQDGTVRVVDAKDKELYVRKGVMSPGKAPDLNPDTKNLVVLPLPYRTPEHVRKTLKIENKRLEDLRMAEALPLFAAYLGQDNGGEALGVFHRCFHNRDQRQLGYYVLLASAGVNLDAQHANVLGEHLDEPLAQYLALHSSPVLRKHAAQWAVNSASWGEGFLQHLATTHAMLQRWSSDKIVRGDAARFKIERARAFEYVTKHKDSIFGWSLLCAMQDRAAETRVPIHADAKPSEYTVDKDFFGQLADAFKQFEVSPALGYAARYEQARCLHRSGNSAESRKRFHDLYAESFKDDVLPAIDSDYRQVMLGTKGDPDWWSEQLRRTAKRLVEQKRRPAIFALAWQCWQLNDQALAKTLFAAAMDKIDDAKEKTAMTLAGVEFLWHTNQVAHADELLKQLAADKELQKQAGLWRMAVKFADHRDMAVRGLESLEKALEIEYQKLPPIIDLETVRREYGRLLSHYDKLAESMVTLNVRPSPEFLAKVVRVADRWRALDRENNEPCTQAAWILQRLGDRELGWDYLTTPIAMKPNEAQPWLTLASNLARKGDLDLADRAFKSAFETEPTNAQILWDRAENLRRLGKSVEAAALFRQIADGNWQPRFQGLVNQARTQAQN